jgi:Icc-related predicted phosphoesterase
MGYVTRILAIADEVDQALYDEKLMALRPDIVVACGDLPFDYLEYIVTMTNVPLVFVPGNHDPDLRHKPAWLDAKNLVTPMSYSSMTRVQRGPDGCTNVDGRVVDVKSIRVAGLGGCVRYKPGPNQYTQAEMRRRALRLELRARIKGALDGREVDLLVTHAPPAGVGDGDDPAHRGFASFHRLVTALAPKLQIHGHVHPYGRVHPRRSLAATEVVNVVGRHLLEVS